MKPGGQQVRGTPPAMQRPVVADMRTSNPESEVLCSSGQDGNVSYYEDVTMVATFDVDFAWQKSAGSRFAQTRWRDDPSPMTTAGKASTYSVNIGFLRTTPTPDDPIVKFRTNWDGSGLKLKATTVRDEEHPVEFRIPIDPGRSSDENYVVAFVSAADARMMDTMHRKGNQVIVRGHPE